MVLFFFSAASTFDVTDLPLLTELRKSLPFIPIRFVVTRADEFRRARHQLLDASNFDEQHANSFLADVIARLNKATGFALTLEPGDFFLIDNIDRFRIDLLKEFLTTVSDETTTSARIQMHGHKVQFFRDSATECLNILGGRLATQFDDIEKIVTTAKRNVERFEACIMPSNLTITKRWAEELQRLTGARATETAAQPVLKALPVTIADLPQTAEAFRQFQANIDRDAQARASRIAQKVASEALNHINLYLANMQQELANLDIREADPLSINHLYSAKTSFDLDGTELHSLSIRQWVNEATDRCFTAIEDLYLSTKDNCERLERRIAGGHFAKAAQGALSVAAEVLDLELDKYFEIVLIYHGSVFARHVKEAISRAGLGRRLDELEHDMSIDQREETKTDARSRLLNAFAQGLVKYESALSKLGVKADALRARAAALHVERTIGDNDAPEWMKALDSERQQLSEEISQSLANNVDIFIQEVEAQMGKDLIAAKRKFGEEKRELSSSRTKRFGSLMAGGAVLGLGSFALYHFFKGPANHELGATILIGAASGILGNLVGYVWAKLTDSFPRFVNSLAKEHSEALRLRLYETCTFKKDNYRALETQEEDISHRLSKLMSMRLSQYLIEDDRSYATPALQLLNSLREEYETLRNEFFVSLESLLQSATQALGQPQLSGAKLEEIATEIRSREISPSFAVLDETRAKFQEVQESLNGIAFS